MSRLLQLVEGRFDADKFEPSQQYRDTWGNDPQSGALPDPTRPMVDDEEIGDGVEDDVVLDEEEEFQNELVDVLSTELGAKCQTFADSGTMTRNKGLIVRLNNGQTFQLTIVRRN